MRSASSPAVPPVCIIVLSEYRQRRRRLRPFLQEVSGALQFLDRPLPCFAPDNDSPETVGFIGGNFMTGLAPHEVFAASGVTRQQMGDQSIYTGKCGHFGRKLEHLLESEHTAWGGSVLTFGGLTVQQFYGGDGLLPERIETITVLPPQAGEPRAWGLACRNALNRCWLPATRPLRLSVCMNPERWLLGGQEFVAPGPPASPAEYAAELERWDRKIHSMHGLATRHTRALCWCIFRPSTRLSVQTLRNMLLFALLSFESCIVPAGLPIGMLAATSVSAPINQWSLNSVHASSAGSASSSNVVSNLCLTVEGAAKQPCVLRAKPTFRDPQTLAQVVVWAKWRFERVPLQLSEVTSALFADKTFVAAHRVRVEGLAPAWAVAQRLRFSCDWVPQYDGATLTVLLTEDVRVEGGESGFAPRARICDDGHLEIDGGVWENVPSLVKYIDPTSLVCSNTHSTLNVLGVESAVITTAGKLVALMRGQGETVLARHMDAIARRMGKTGQLHGANSKGVSHGPPLTSGKFEKCVPTLMKNALTGAAEKPLTSLSGVVLTGGQWKVYTDIVSSEPVTRSAAQPPLWRPQSPIVQPLLEVPAWVPDSPLVEVQRPALVSTNVGF